MRVRVIGWAACTRVIKLLNWPWQVLRNTFLNCLNSTI